MTKTEFITYLSNKSDYSKENSKKIINATLLAIEDALVQDGRIVLKGFGIFTVRKLPSRNGYNIKTGEVIEIPGGSKIIFKPAKRFLEELNLI